MPKPYLVGITGTIGAGKSLVGKMLADHGYLVVDTDRVVHDLFASDPHLQRAITQRFGASIISNSGTIDRTRLGLIVFNDDDARKDLEAIVHPAVISACEKIVDENKQQPVLFFLVPLLFEANLEKNYDAIWAVTTKDDVLIQRLKARTNLTEEELRRRISAQMAQQEKAQRSNSVIDNSGTIEETGAQVTNILNKLNALKQN